MDIAGMTVSTVAASTQPTEMSVAVMRKVLDGQQAAAAQVVNTIEQSGSALPDNLGQNINVTA